MKRELSQLEMSRLLDISRPSYVAIEQGKRDLTVPEAKKLSDFFGVPFEEFSGAPEQKYEKYKQMILAILRSKASYKGRFPKTKLAKLLYLSDFTWYYQNLESMSGMPYVRRAYGPVPDPYFRALTELEEEGKVAISREGDSILVTEASGAMNEKLDLLSDGEVKLMNKIASKWKNKNTTEIVSFTHNQLPYKLCAPNEVIPYELFIQEDPEHVY